MWRNREGGRSRPEESAASQEERGALDIAVPSRLPVLPIRDTVLFPLVAAPILVGQERSRQLVEDALRGDRLIAVVTERTTIGRPPGPEDLYRVGTVAVIHEMVRAPDGTMRIAVQGLERVQIERFEQTEPYLVAQVSLRPDSPESGVEIEALVRTTRDLFREVLAASGELPEEVAQMIGVFADPRQTVYAIATAIPFSTEARQKLLEADPLSEKLRQLVDLLREELEVRRTMRRISARTSAELAKAQREHILRRYLEMIQRELGEEDPTLAEIRDLRERLAALPLGEEARQEVDRELARLTRIPSTSPEYSVVRTYLDWIAKLPWGKTTGVPIDVPRAREVLDQDHYDLERVKERILEYLAVRKLREERAAELSLPDHELRHEPILCFVGPPGVGKTSLGQSIARAMGRRFARVSLGGIHDEAEIRGHRRTYIGALPGRILQTLARAGTADPVFMLDEIDKLGVGFHGDPSAALLEVLDPAQNHAFVDTYLGVPFDLSRVLFICTANTVEPIPPALLDRMEVIRLSGYTDAEKLEVARRYLLPRQRAVNGLREGEVFVDDAAIRRVIREYTREAGLRNLERELGTILRKAARRISEGEPPPIRVTARDVPEYLGPQRFFDEVLERLDRPGVATGLGWTPTGGDIVFVEASITPGDTERLILTGMLGDVMRESAQAALTFLRAHAERFGIDPRTFERKVVHVHVPAGSIPKDGPSAGVTILAALASAATGRPVRPDVGMTGEITLRGKILPVGGIKEKVLAAHRAGLRTILLPRRNEGALEEVPEEVRRACEFILIDSAEEVIAHALAPPPTEAREAAPAEEGAPATRTIH